MLPRSVTAGGACDAFDRNLLGVQPVLTDADYASPRTFEARLERYLQHAGDLGWLTERTVVVFPEMIGAWLVFSGGRGLLPYLCDIGPAMASVALSRPDRFLGALMKATGRDRVKDSLFRMRSDEVAGLYHEIFSGLASRSGVTVAAGTVILPEPSIRGGKLAAGEGPLRNACVVFGPDGSPHPRLVFKVHPVAEEKAFVKRGRAEDLPVFDTPAGRLGVLICADSWFPKCYEAIAGRGAELVAVPAYLLGDGTWSRVWPGYSGSRAPADVDPGDPGRITEGEAWLKYAMAGRLEAAGLDRGITVFGRGGIFDLGTDGSTFAVSDGALTRLPAEGGAALLNVPW